MQQQARALQVTQELVAQAGAFGRTFNQTRDVGDHKALLRTDAHHAEVGVQCGERVVGNLGARVRDRRDQRGLAGIGHAQQADVGQHLQFQLQAFLFARPARRLLPRRAVDRTLEAQVAKAAIPALGDGDDLARRQQLIQHVAGFYVTDDGAHRHLQRDVFTSGAKHVGAHAVLPALGIVPARIAVVDQGVQTGIGHGKHMATATTVAAIGAAKFLVLLVPERDAAVPAVARGDVDKGFIYKFHGFLTGVKRAACPNDKAPAMRGFESGRSDWLQTGVITTMCLFIEPLTAKLT